VETLLSPPQFTTKTLGKGFSELSNRVRDYKPDVVVLLARKMPRIARVLDLDFGESITLSDMAFPFVEQLIRGKKIAVVDDFVNVGTTIGRGAAIVQSFAPADARLFALAASSVGDENNGTSYEFVFPSRLEPEEYTHAVTELPRLLEGSAEAYDLEFPLIRCRYNFCVGDFNGLVESLQHEFGRQRISLLQSMSGKISRCTLSLPWGDAGDHSKIRFYQDRKSKRVNLVPIVVPGVVSLQCLHKAEEVFQYLVNDSEFKFNALPDPNRDARVRLALFLKSLSTFNQIFPKYLLKYVSPIDLGLYDDHQASLAFGPRIATRNAHRLIEEAQSSFREAPGDPYSKCSPFSDSSVFQSVVLACESQTHLQSSPAAILEQFFHALGDEVCAEDPSSFTHDSPYQNELIKQYPYLRLRIGPSFADLVSYLISVRCMRLEDARIAVSRFLDESIDEGFVVPTVAAYESGESYRIYRKGENKELYNPLNTLDHAISDCEKIEPRPVMKRSRTHFTKVAAIAAHSNVTPALFSTKTDERGVVACLPEGVLSFGGEEVILAMAQAGIRAIDDLIQTQPEVSTDYGSSDQKESNH
jgi:hypothetical protein